MLLVGFPGDSDDKESACNTGDLSQCLGWKDLLEKEMATHSSILAWENLMDKGSLLSTVESDMTEHACITTA